MRPAAKVHELAVAIEADLVAGRGEFGHEVGLHEVAVALKLFQRLLSWREFAHERLVARNHLGHLGFDQRQVLGREGLFAMKIVEEAGVGGRAVAQLGLGKQLQHRRGQHVRGGVAQHLERLGVLLGDQLQARVRGQRRGQVHQARSGRVLGGIHGGFRLAVEGWIFLDDTGDWSQPRNNSGRGQPRRDGVGNLQRRCAGRHFANRSVGQVYGNCLLAHGG